jgi:Protein of unknown function (DUF1549)/Protein of unknown function (DUF1553)
VVFRVLSPGVTDMKRKTALSHVVLMTSFLFLGVSTTPGQDTAAKKEMRLKRKADDAKKAADTKQATEEAQKKELAQRAAINKGVEQNQPQSLKPAFLGGNEWSQKAVTAFIDRQIHGALQADKLATSPVCTDEEFLRRVYLDITGVIPTPEQSTAFLSSREPSKRAQLIEQLLSSPKYAQHQADIWTGLLIQKTSDNRRVDFSELPKWLAKKFEANTPWDQLVTEILNASGTMESNPAVGFFLSNNTVDKMTDETNKLFLGVQLQCAQCHDHKFNDWKQTDYWSMAQFFMKVQVGNLKQPNGEVSVKEVDAVNRGRNNQLPESAMKVPARFLQDRAPDLSKNSPYRTVLAQWMTAPSNPFFAKAMVNRTWAQFFGRGIVNPIDDLVGQNEPSHPELLNGLSADFAANRFDIKQLIRSICNSDAYQRSTKSVPGNEKSKPEQYAKMTVKVLTPEQLFDSLAQVVGFDQRPTGREKGPQKRDNLTARERFVNFYLGGAEMSSPIDYEAGIPQALKLMNSRQVGIQSQTVRKIVGNAQGTEAIEKLYLATLSRSPTKVEVEKLTQFVSKSSSSTEALSDVLWAILNSSEFTLNR